MSIAKTLIIAKERWMALDLKYRLLRLGYEVSVTLADTADSIQSELETTCPNLVFVEGATPEIIEAIQAANLPLLCFNTEVGSHLPCLANPHDETSLRTAIFGVLHQQRTQSRLKQQLRRNQQQVELFHAVDHELRTPLSTMLVTLDWIQLIEQENLSEDSLRKLEHLGLARHSVGQMAELLDRASVLYQTHSDKLIWKPTVIELQPFCKAIIAEVESHISHPGIELILPRSVDVDHQIEFDRLILRQILVNLLSNAMKYSASKVHLMIDLTAENLVMQVRDTGIGIPDRDLDLIFAPLYRGSNVRNIPGTGMGLAIVQQLVSNCRGMITVESVPNRETTFTVRLPLKFPTFDR